MLKIEVDGDEGLCKMELNGRSTRLIAEMHSAIQLFSATIISCAAKNGCERDVAMKMAEGFATAFRDVLPSASDPGTADTRTDEGGTPQ